MNATQEQPQTRQPNLDSELFLIVWTSNGTDWHIVMQENGNQALAVNLEKAEHLLVCAKEYLRTKLHSTDGADVRIMRAVTPPIRRTK